MNKLPDPLASAPPKSTNPTSSSSCRTTAKSTGLFSIPTKTPSSTPIVSSMAWLT